MQAAAQPDEAQEQGTKVVTRFKKKINKPSTAELKGKMCKGYLCAGRNHVKVKNLYRNQLFEMSLKCKAIQSFA